MIITCLHPEKRYETGEANEYSIVLDMSYGDFHALLTGDLEGEGEEKLLDTCQAGESIGIGDYEYTLLKVAHHGSANSTSEDFLQQFSPHYAVISCGVNNSYGHPHKELLDRLEKAGVKVLRTDEVGAIEIKVKGEQVKVSGYVK